MASVATTSPLRESTSFGVLSFSTSEAIIFIVKLSGLNPMTVESDRTEIGNGLLCFLNKGEYDYSPVLTVNLSSLEYYGPEGAFQVNTKRS